MENLAPDLKRQRVLIEGFFEGDVDEPRVRDYFVHVCEQLNFTAYGDPIITSPKGLGKKENQGYDAFLPLIDSGISVYVWSSSKFFSIILYTCKEFDTDKVVEVTKNFWQSKKIVQMSF